jgi:DNA repair exonuclease SbcCD ATPase subunit
MIQLKSLTMKNFLSTGAVTQCVDFNNQGLTLVLGENLDLGGNGSRNGVGKCLRGSTQIEVMFSSQSVTQAFEAAHATIRRGNAHTVTMLDVVLFYRHNPFYEGEIQVLTRHGYHTIEYADVTAFDSEVWQVKVGESDVLHTNGDHLLFGSHGWVSVKELEIGMPILTKLGWQPVTQLELLPTREDLYDLQVEKVHEFYANNVVSHNSTLFNALSYALYGQAISNIKRDNLINTVNKKNMSVTVEFEKDGVNHRIERGRKPNFFKYQINDQTVEGDASDEAQGENKDTQREIDQALGLSWSMFRHIVCLNTYTEPFLMMGSGKQREIIEELLGITLLSQKAETLRELIKLTKNKIDGEEFKISTIKSSNQRILNAAQELENKIINWSDQQKAQLSELEVAITSLASLDVEVEIQSHKNNATRTEILNQHRSIGRELAATRQQRDQLKKEQQRVMQQQLSLQSHACPSCGQTVHDTQKQLMQSQVDLTLVKLDGEISQLDPMVLKLEQALLDLESQRDLLPEENTIYSTLEAAYDHRNSLLQLEREKQRVSLEENPYVDQLASLNNTLQETSYDEINSLTELKEHQEFLLKLLTNKDSFIRKRIIDQNLSYLNHRLMEYLSTLGITHEVTFKNDLSVEINYMGQDMDFAQLSRGESTRVILSLSWAFRDIWENMNNSINFLGVDELIDVGLDSAGVERAIEILKNMGRDRNKSVFLISHRDELLPRCDHVLSVIKENGFTRLSNEWDSL